MVDAQFGNWKWEVIENESSNFRESANLVNSLRSYLKSGRIEQGSEVFICTDNAVTESTYFKGSSKSSKLHDLIVDLRRLEMEGDLIVHFLWISGRRMIKQGTDGLSRGDFSSGVMQGRDFLQFLPFNESVLERQENLKNVIKSWFDETNRLELHKH